MNFDKQTFDCLHFQPQSETDCQVTAADCGGREGGERQEPEPDQQQQERRQRGQCGQPQLRVWQPGGGEDGQGNQAAELSPPGLPLKSESRLLSLYLACYKNFD